MAQVPSIIPVQLQRLVRKADSTAIRADAVVREAMREIRGALAVAATEEPVARSASVRERLFARIRRRMDKMRKRLDDLSRAALKYAGKLAAERATAETGVTVRYSKRHADDVIALLSPKQGENLAAVFTDKMTKQIIGELRTAVVSAFQENAVSGGTLQGLASAIGRKWQRTAQRRETYRFVDSAGREWDTRTYLNMNTRTTAMRVYNDLLVENLAKATGSDLVRVSRGGDPNCPQCFPWEGVILSVSGNTPGFPTYDQAKAAGCFHPNCVHTLEAIDETADADEIARQRRFPVKGNEDATNPDAADERRYRIDQQRYRDAGLSAEAARVAVDRDNLADSLRNGLVTEDAEAVVRQLTDEQVTKLCPNGNPPAFEPTKGTKAKPDPERWNHGKRGGVVHIGRENLTASRLLEVCGVT